MTRKSLVLQSEISSGVKEKIRRKILIDLEINIMCTVFKAITFMLILTLSFGKLFAADIPIIVIAPSNKAQSKSTVGTSVTVFDEESIENSNDFFFRRRFRKQNYKF